MTLKHPIRGYRFLPQHEVDNFDIEQIGQHNKHGFFLEVDLSFPPEVQDLTFDLCLAPEKQDISYEDLSPYAKELHDKCYPSKKGRHKSTKLTAGMSPRRKYVCHGENLKYYVSLGVVLPVAFIRY